MEEASLTVWHASTSRVPADATTVHNNDRLEQMLGHLTAVMVRELIQDKIDEFQVALGEMFQKIAVLLHCTKVINVSGSPTIVDEHTIVDAANHLIQKCEPIIKYLDFIKEKTGLPSGGDPSLESEVIAAREWANILINAFKALKKVERAAGGLQKIKPNHCILLSDGRVIIGNHSGEWIQASIAHPIMRTPGTQWHKWFAFSLKGTHTEDRSQIPHHPRVSIPILRPRSADFIKQLLRTQFRRYDKAFNRRNRKPAPKALRKADVAALYSLELETCVDPKPYNSSELQPFYLEENHLCLRPQTTASGHVPFEEFNYTLNGEIMRGRFIQRNNLNPYLRRRVPGHILFFLSQPNADIIELDADVPRYQEPIFSWGTGHFDPPSEDQDLTYDDYVDFFPPNNAAPGVDGDDEQDDEFMDEDDEFMDEDDELMGDEQDDELMEDEQNDELMEDEQDDEAMDDAADGNYGI